MAIGTALAIAGLVTSVYGQIKSGQAASRAGAAAAERDQFNASVADLQAKDALAGGADEESQFRTQVRGLIGTQRVGFASQNVDVRSGSAADVQADAAYLGELDAQRIRANAARQAWGFQVQAADYRHAAAVDLAGGQAAATAAYFGAGATALTGTSQLMDRYGWGQKKKKPAA